MGPTGIILILALIIASGFVAWAGDVLGRVMGKRRISLFGLRPRRTSVVIGVITGMLITIGTVLVLALASSSVRVMLFQIDEKLREIVSLTNEVRDLSGQRDSLVAERDEARATIDTLMTTIHEGQAAVATLTSQLSTVQTDLDSLNEEVGRKTEEIQELERDRDRLQADYEAAAAERDALNEEIELSRSTLASLNNEIRTLRATIASLRQERDSLLAQVRQLETGEVKVYEGQQLAVFSIDTLVGIDTIYNDLQSKVNGIPASYVDPVSGERVLAENEMEVNPEQYVEALDDIRAISSQYAIVIVYAAANVVEDQPVPVRLEITRNYRVYTNGTLIYSNTYYEPAGETEQPYRATFAQFFEDARNYLVNERSLIPITSGEALQLTIDDLLELSRRLADVGFPAELRLVALTDIYRTDFLVYGEQFTVTILPATAGGDAAAPE